MDTSFTIHEACEALPPLPPKAYADLRESIKAIGLQQPILLAPDGRVLDGKNRLRACRDLNITPRTAPAELGDREPLAFVLSLNRHRLRTTSQLALAGARLVTATHGGDRVNQHTGGKSSMDDLMDRKAVAKLLKVSPIAIDRARYVLEHGVPELVSYVEAGEVALRAAWDAAHADTATQTDACAQDPKTVRALAQRQRQLSETGPTSLDTGAAFRQFVRLCRDLPDLDREGEINRAIKELRKLLPKKAAA